MIRAKWKVLVFVAVGLLVGVASFLRVRQYELIGDDQLYRPATNQVYQFVSSKDRKSYQWTAFWKGDQLAKARKVGQETYLGHSKPLSPLVEVGESEEDYHYAPKKGQVVTVDGLRFPTLYEGVEYTFHLEARSKQKLYYYQEIQKTDYELSLGKRPLSITVLSSEEEAGTLAMEPVTE